MVKLGLILCFNKIIDKYKTCMLTMMIKNLFSKVKRCTKLLKLVYSDVCNLHNTPFDPNLKLVSNTDKHVV